MYYARGAKRDIMKILWLLSSTGKKSEREIVKCNPDFIISFGYRYIIPYSIVRRYYRKAINVHISYLPWNRGASPNLWSFVDDTPKGVTIHYIDKGIDTGDILLQKEFTFDDKLTLRQTHKALVREGWHLLFSNFDSLLRGEIPAKKQPRYHSVAESEELAECLPSGWDTEAGTVRGLKC